MRSVISIRSRDSEEIDIVTEERRTSPGIFKKKRLPSPVQLGGRNDY
jgi:hypothetical protein